MLSKFNSDKFRFWSFISMTLLVFVHGYNLDPRFMYPWTEPNEAISWTSFTEYFFANGILRFRIPMLFAISGYLYALYDNQPHAVRVKKRVRTLLLPYVLISGISLLLIYLLEYYPPARAAIEASHVAQADSQGMRLAVHDYRWYDVILRGILFPLPYQLWFIRVLFFYCLIYPLIRSCVMGVNSRYIFFVCAILLWFIGVPPILLEGEGLLFFSLGVWLQKTNFNLDVPDKKLMPCVWGCIFISAAALKTWLAFNGRPHLGGATFYTLVVLHKLVIVSGLITAWFSSNKIVNWCMNQQWFVWATGFSFMIYALHAPMVALAIDPFFKLLNYSYGYRMVTFVFLPLTIIAFIILFGALLRKIAPTIYSTLTGGRGMS